MSKLPRSILRSRRHRQPWLAPVAAAIAKHNPGPGTVTEVRTWHRHDCPMPSGRGPCCCRPDEIEIEAVGPLRN